MSDSIKEEVDPQQLLQALLLEKNQVHELKQKIQNLTTENQALQEQHKKLAEMLRKLQNNPTPPTQDESLLQERLQHIEQLERVIHHLRDKCEEATLEKGQLQEEHQAAHETIALLNEQVTTLQHAIEEEKKEWVDQYEVLREDYTQVSERLEEALSARIEAETACEAFQSQEGEFREKITELTTQLAAESQARETMQTEWEVGKEQLKEAVEERLTAQHHLAKKVEEVARLYEQIEEHKGNLVEFRSELKTAKTQIADLQATLDGKESQEIRFQEQLKKLEDKYFDLYDKWKETEAENKRLHLLEEKYNQMQAFLANVGQQVNPVSSEPFPFE